MQCLFFQLFIGILQTATYPQAISRRPNPRYSDSMWPSHSLLESFMFRSKTRLWEMAESFRAGWCFHKSHPHREHTLHTPSPGASTFSSLCCARPEPQNTFLSACSWAQLPQPRVPKSLEWLLLKTKPTRPQTVPWGFQPREDSGLPRSHLNFVAAWNFAAVTRRYACLDQKSHTNSILQ